MKIIIVQIIIVLNNNNYSFMGGLLKRIPSQLKDKAYELAFKGYSINYSGKGGVHMIAKKKGFPNSVMMFRVDLIRVVQFYGPIL